MCAFRFLTSFPNGRRGASPPAGEHGSPLPGSGSVGSRAREHAPPATLRSLRSRKVPSGAHRRPAGTELTILSLLSLLLIINPARAEVTTQAVYSEPDGNSDITKVAVGPWQLPDKTPDGFYRVKQIRSEICNTDRRVLAGTKRAEVAQKKVVMGHEGIGRIEQLPAKSGRSDLKIGDLVVIGPHFVEPDDEMLKKGLPNLSPKMKHTGIHINGVFANLMDYAEYTITKIPNAEEMLKRTSSPQTYYDQMVMIEPLACVQRGYKLLQKQDYYKKGQLHNALVLGTGPMGAIHAFHMQNKFPAINVDCYDIDPIRRKLFTNIPSRKAKVLETLDYSKKYDIVVTATSSEEASTKEAIRLVKDNGVILLFSGIDLKEGEAHPQIDSVDIEDVHRYEGSVRLMNHEVDGKPKSIYFLGTSGYVDDDFLSSIAELHQDILRSDKAIYRGISTTVVQGLDNHVAKDLSKQFHDAKFDTPALIQLLKVYDPKMEGDYNVHNYLKIFVRHD